MKTVILLFHQSHFDQIFLWLKNIKEEKRNEIIIIALDPHSLRKVKEYGYAYLHPDYRLKEDTRQRLFKNLPLKIIEWGALEIYNGMTVQNYLRVNNVDIWDIVKNRICIWRLFDKLYFIELVRHMLLDACPDKLIIPSLPSEISLLCLNTIKRKTIIDLAESLGITVSSVPLSTSTLLQYMMKYTANSMRQISAALKIMIQRSIPGKVLNKRKIAFEPKYANGEKRKRILVCGYFPDFDPRPIIPVLVALNLKGYDCKVLINRYDKAETINLLIKENVSIVFTDDYKNTVDRSYITKALGLYNKKWHDLKRSRIDKTLFFYNGVSLWDNEYQDTAIFLNPHTVMNILKDYELIKKVLRSEETTLLIFPNDQTVIGKIYAKLGEEEGIPCLCIPSLVDQLAENILILDSIVCGKYAVAGKGFCESFKRQDLNIKDLVVTGPPQCDGYFKAQMMYNRNEIYKALNLSNNGNGIFLFTMQRGLPENTEVLRIMINAMKNFPDKYLIIRPHPVDSDVSYASYIKRFGLKNIILSKKLDFWSIASISKIIFTVYSLTGFEAILLNKPVITVNLSCFPDFIPYTRYGAALGVYKEEELISAINKILHDPLTGERLDEGRKRILEDYVYKLDGGSTERIVNLAEQLICSVSRNAPH